MKRSSEQHNYEWACYRIIGKETGDTPYSVYEFFSELFLKEINEAGDPVIRKPTSLEDWEHSIYMEQIHHFVARFMPGFVWPERSVNNYEFKPIKKSTNEKANIQNSTGLCAENRRVAKVNREQIDSRRN